jgi:hypothetical protein
VSLVISTKRPGEKFQVKFVPIVKCVPMVKFAPMIKGKFKSSKNQMKDLLKSSKRKKTEKNPKKR